MRIKAYLFLTITSLAWAANAVAGRLAVGHISPLMLTSLRWSVAFAAIALISVPELRRDWPVIRAHKWQLLAYGAWGFALFNAIFYTALQYTSAINVVIEQASMPVFIFLGNFLLFRTRVNLFQLGGFALTLLGVAMTAANGDLTTLFRLQLNKGDALMFLAVIVYASYTVLLRYKPALHWKSFMAGPALGAMLAAMPLAGYEAAQGQMLVPDAFGWGLVLFVGLVPSLVAQILFIRGVDLIGPNRAGLFVNLVPIFGTIMAIVFAGETPHLFHAVSLLLVIGGIVLAERGRNAGARGVQEPGTEQG